MACIAWGSKLVSLEVQPLEGAQLNFWSSYKFSIITIGLVMVKD